MVITKNVEIIIICIIISARFLFLAEAPPGIAHDEARIAGHAICIGQDLTDLHGRYLPFSPFAGLNGVYSTTHTYGLSIWFKIFGCSISSLRAFSVLLSIIASILLFFVTKEIFDSRTALFALFFDAISTWTFHFSRLGWDHGSSNLWILLSLLLILKIKDKPSAFLAALAAALSLYTYASHQFFSIFVFLAALAIKRIDRETLLPEKKIFFPAFLVLAIPIVISLIQGTQLGRLHTASNILHKDLPSALSLILENFYAHFSLKFLLTEGDKLGGLYGTTVSGNLSPLEFICCFFTVGKILFFFSKKLFDKDKISDAVISKSFVIWVLILIGILPSALCEVLTPNSMRIVNTAPFFHILAAIGLVKLQSTLPQVLIRLAIAASLIYYFLIVNYYFTDYTEQSRDQTLDELVLEVENATNSDRVIELMQKNLYSYVGFLGLKNQVITCEELRLRGLEFEETNVDKRKEFLKKQYFEESFN